MYISPLKINSHKTNEIYFCEFDCISTKKIEYLKEFSVCFNKISYVSTSLNLNLSKRKHSESQKRMFLFFEFCFSVNKSHAIFLVPNLFCFISLSMLNYCAEEKDFGLKPLMRENTLYRLEIKSTKKNKTLIFQDAYSLTNLSLEFLYSLFKFYSLNTVKVETASDIKDSRRFAKSFLKYREFIFNKFDVDLITSFSLSSLALKIYRSKFYSLEKNPIENVFGNKDSFIRSSFWGGVVDVYKPFLKRGFHYDVNSLYPFIMAYSDMPIGTGKFVNRISNLNDFFGFIEADIDAPASLYIPLLVYLDKQRGLIAPSGRWSGVFFSEELKIAYKLGYKIKLKRGIAYNRGNPFQSYIEFIFALKQKYKSKPIAEILKLLMNGLYGRFGMRSETEQILVLDNEDSLLIWLYHNFDILEHTILSRKSILKFKLKNDEFYNNFNDNKIVESNSSKFQITGIQIASAISSYARIFMHKYKTANQDNVFYSDTDSLFTNKPLNASDVSDTELGKFRLVGEVSEALFLAPKLYYVEYSNDNILLRSKGASKSNISKEDILRIYEQENSIDFRVGNFFTKKATILGHKLSGISLKRIKKYNAANMWTDTAPHSISLI